MVFLSTTLATKSKTIGVAYVILCSDVTIANLP